MHKSDNKKVKLYKKSIPNKSSNTKWMIGIVLWTFFTSALISYLSELIISNASILIAFIILIIIVLVGIFFDIIGVAVTAADETPFHSLASRRVRGARTAVYFIRNANKVSNLCNDVIGDVCGVISGGTGAVIIQRIIVMTDIGNKVILSLAVSALIASITVGGKAVGKNIAIYQSNNIVYSVAWFIETLKRKK